MSIIETVMVGIVIVYGVLTIADGIYYYICDGKGGDDDA